MRRRIRSAAFPVHRHSVPQLLVDGVLVALAYFLAFRLRFPSGFHGNERYSDLLVATIPWVVPVALVVLAAFGVYQRLWTFVSQRDYENVFKAVVVTTLLVVGAITLLHPVEQLQPTRGCCTSTRRTREVSRGHSRERLALFFLLALALLGGARFLAHLVSEGRVTSSFRVGKDARDVLIVGGGDGGHLVARELVRNPLLRLRPVGFVDDDPRKSGIKARLRPARAGYDRDRGPRAGARRGRAGRSRDRDPVGSGDVARPRVAACRDRGIPFRTLPTVFELLKDGSGQMQVARQLREVRVEDMLGREPVVMELERVGAYLRERGRARDRRGWLDRPASCAARSRAWSPRRLVLVDHAEDNLFEIQRELEEDRHVRDRRAGARRLPRAGADARGDLRAPPVGGSSTPPPTST